MLAQICRGKRVVLVSATLYVLLNLVADVLYFMANPRLRGG